MNELLFELYWLRKLQEVRLCILCDNESEQEFEFDDE